MDLLAYGSRPSSQYNQHYNYPMFNQIQDKAGLFDHPSFEMAKGVIMNEEKIAIEAVPEADEAIRHLAKIRLAKRYIISEERYWVDRIKSLISPASCDKILAERDGEIVTVATYKLPYPKFDTRRFKQDHADIYNEYLRIPIPEEKYLYIQEAALPEFISKIRQTEGTLE